MGRCAQVRWPRWDARLLEVHARMASFARLGFVRWWLVRCGLAAPELFEVGQILRATRGDLAADKGFAVKKRDFEASVIERVPTIPCMVKVKVCDGCKQFDSNGLLAQTKHYVGSWLVE